MEGIFGTKSGELVSKFSLLSPKVESGEPGDDCRPPLLLLLRLAIGNGGGLKVGRIGVGIAGIQDGRESNGENVISAGKTWYCIE